MRERWNNMLIILYTHFDIDAFSEVAGGMVVFNEKVILRSNS